MITLVVARERRARENKWGEAELAWGSWGSMGCSCDGERSFEGDLHRCGTALVGGAYHRHLAHLEGEKRAHRIRFRYKVDALNVHA